MALKTQYQCYLNFYVTFGFLFPYEFWNFRVANCNYLVSLEWLHLYWSYTIFPTIIS